MRDAGSCSSDNDEMWSDSGYILKVGSIGFLSYYKWSVRNRRVEDLSNQSVGWSSISISLRIHGLLQAD